MGVGDLKPFWGLECDKYWVGITRSLRDPIVQLRAENSSLEGDGFWIDAGCIYRVEGILDPRLYLADSDNVDECG